ncbi:AAA family ATPase [Gracilibacillus sp. JCM 18860]|uniref:AAA family ATPase n=1 Tax=Gracilibacillus sp. JCM 18860 TaxID=1306159 RepID=UPI003260490E
MAVIAPGELVILDEPTNDVDPVRRSYLWQVIRDLTKNGSSVILVTHNVLEAEKAVDRVAIMDKGKIVTQGNPSEVKSLVGDRMRIELSLEKEFKNIEVPGWALSPPHQNGSRLIFSLDPPSKVSSTIDWAKNQTDKGLVIDYSLSPTTIEDVYIELTSKKGVVS